MISKSLRIIAYLAFLCAFHSQIQCLDENELNELFSESHIERLSEENATNERVKRSAFNYNYHASESESDENIHSLKLMQNYHKSSDKAAQSNSYATTALKVSAKLLSAKINPLQAKELKTMQAPKTFCPFEEKIECVESFPYRTFDGSCNNVKNPWWGKVETPFKRWISSDYSDEFKLSEPRAASDGSELPNPRKLACAMNGDRHEIEKNVTHLLMQWGQLVNHDITSLSIAREDDPDQSICSKCTKTHKCLPVMIEDEFECNCMKTMKHNCIEFTRSSATFGDVECRLGAREQMNMQTSFLDGSHIYGTSFEQSENLRDRSLNRGQLKMQMRGPGANDDLLPHSNDTNPGDCLDFTLQTRCFIAGDDRVNQNPSLMSMQTIFAREHNRIATQLSIINPTWNDDIVFQEARRVVVAMIQHITYNEYLPIVLGDQIMQLFSLKSGKGAAHLNSYDPNLDPRITNEYSACAGRWGHSTVRTEYSRVDSTYKSRGLKSFMLRNSYFRANDLYDRAEGSLEAIVRGMMVDPLMKVDSFFSTDLTQHLFETKSPLMTPFHFDLVSININRGRDHGIPGYPKFREFCGLPPVNSWEDMKKFIPSEVVTQYRQFYKSVRDVDTFLAVISEFKSEKMLVGPTLSCLLGLQFQGLKYGDRFWYETAQSPADFTSSQLTELRKVTLARLLCKNMNDTPKMQPSAFLSSRVEGNELVDCSSMGDINLSFWRIPM